MNFRRLKLRCGRSSVNFAQTRPFRGVLLRGGRSVAGPGVPPGGKLAGASTQPCHRQRYPVNGARCVAERRDQRRLAEGRCQALGEGDRRAFALGARDDFTVKGRAQGGDLVPE